MNSFNAQYGFMPYTSSLNKEEILGLLKNFDLKTQAEFFDCYADFYKNSISPEMLKYTQDLKICVGLEQTMNKSMNEQNAYLIAVLCFAISLLFIAIYSCVKKDISASFVFGAVGLADGAQLCCSSGK